MWQASCEILRPTFAEVLLALVRDRKRQLFLFTICTVWWFLPSKDVAIIMIIMLIAESAMRAGLLYIFARGTWKLSIISRELSIQFPGYEEQRYSCCLDSIHSINSDSSGLVVNLHDLNQIRVLVGCSSLEIAEIAVRLRKEVGGKGSELSDVHMPR